MENYIEYSKQIKKLAEQLVQESGIEVILKKFGELEITGSFKYDLMYKPDIDYYVYQPNLSKNILGDVARDLILGDYFNKVYFEDTYTSKASEVSPGIPKGYYIRLDKEFQGKEFKFDIWIVENQTQKNALFSEEDIKLIDKLESGDFTEEERENILKLKHYKYQSKESLLRNVRTFEIYKAVLIDGISDTEAFLGWLRP